MATQTFSALGTIQPDATGRCWIEPYDVTATNDVWKHPVIRFANPSAGQAHGFYGTFVVPPNYNSAPVISPYWSSTVITGNVRWRFSYRAIGGSNTESLDQAGFQQQALVTAAAPGATNRRMTANIALTAANLAAGDTVEYLFERFDDAGGDTLVGDVVLHDLMFSYGDAGGGEKQVILRSALPSLTTSVDSFIMSGYAAVGDYGAGAMYSKFAVGGGAATSGGPMAIQDAAGVWFNLVVQEGIIHAGHFGATGDGSTDDTAPLQAAINYMMAQRNISQLHLHSGSFKITAGLTVGAATPTPNGSGGIARNGIVISGVGNSYDRLGFGGGGTEIRYIGAGVTSILTIFNTAYVHFSVRDLAISYRERALTASGTGFPASAVRDCIYIPTTINGWYTFRNIHVMGTTNGINMDGSVNSQNGEDYIFDNVWGQFVDCFYNNSDPSAQAYNHVFINCGGTLLAGGTYFKHAGSGITIVNFSATGISQSLLAGGSQWISNTTFLEEQVISSGTVAVLGGRIESLTRLLCNDQLIGDPDVQSRTQINIIGLQCVLDNTPSDADSGTNTLNGFINMRGADMVTIQSCSFDCQPRGVNTAMAFDIVDGTPFLDWLIKFRECNFNRTLTHPKLLASPKVRFEDCQNSQQGWDSWYVDRFTAIKTRTVWSFADRTSNIFVDYDPRTPYAIANSTSAQGQVKTTSIVPAVGRVSFGFDIGTLVTGVYVGICNAAHLLTSDLGGSDGFSLGYGADGSVRLNGSLLVANGATSIAAGGRGQIAIDFINRTFWVRRVLPTPGNWNNNASANPSTNTLGLSLASLGAPPYFICAQIPNNTSEVFLLADLAPPAGGFATWSEAAISP